MNAVYQTSGLEGIQSQNREDLTTFIKHNVNIKDKGNIMVKPCQLKAEKVEKNHINGESIDHIPWNESRNRIF